MADGCKCEGAGAKQAPIAVVGAGTFGIAVTSMLRRKGLPVRLWCHSQSQADAINETGKSPAHLPDCDISGTWASSDAAQVVQGAQAVILVTPSFGLRAVVEACAAQLADAPTPILILTKGLDPASGRLFIDVVADAVGNRGRIAVLSGPNHAEELAQGLLAGAVVASDNIETARFFQGLISTDTFRLYAGDDPVGVSLCGAAKNVIAIACGMARGADLGDNAISLLMTRGLSEMSALVEACGGQRITCMGLAGVGDLNATCNSRHSRNGSYGEALAREGISVADYEARRGMVVEGAHAVDPLLLLGESLGVTLPITQAVRSLLDGRCKVEDAARALMERPLKDEL